MAPKKQEKHIKTSDDEYDAHLSADDHDTRRGNRRGMRRQRPDPANTTPVGGQTASEERKISCTVVTKKRDKKPEAGSKGQVKYTDEGALEYYDPDTKRWIPAAYHNDHRQGFLEEETPRDGYDWAPKRGFAEYDETSHMLAQRPWNGEHLDRILDHAGKKVIFDLDRPKLPKPNDPGNWMLGDNVLLDHNNHPVKAWTELNKTLSTEIEDWRWEAIRRLYPWLTTTDILARMPHSRQKTEGGEFVPLQSSRAFTNRAMRFRQPKAIIPTNKRRGTGTIAEYFRSHLKKHNAETADQAPELTAAELKKAKKANKGKFSMNSRYVNEEDNASKSSDAKRKPEEESRDSGHGNTSLRAKRVKKEYGPSPSNPSSPGIFAPLPTPHDRNARISSVKQSNRLTSKASADPEMAAFIPYSEEDEATLVPLFVNLSCEELAAIQDATYTTPMIVLQAKANGCTMLGGVDVRWYDEQVEREIDDDGKEHPNVVMREEWDHGLDLGWRGERCTSLVAPRRLLVQVPAHIPAPATPSSSGPVVVPLPVLPQVSTLPPPTPLPLLPDPYIPGPDDLEVQLYENPWRHDYGPSGH